MGKYTFSTQSGKAYYCNSIPGFIKDTFKLVKEVSYKEDEEEEVE